MSAADLTGRGGGFKSPASHRGGNPERECGAMVCRDGWNEDSLMLLRLQCVETHPAELKPGKHNHTQEVEQDQRPKDELHVRKIQVLDRVCGSRVTPTQT